MTLSSDNVQAGAGIQVLLFGLLVAVVVYLAFLQQPANTVPVAPRYNASC